MDPRVPDTDLMLAKRRRLRFHVCGKATPRGRWTRLLEDDLDLAEALSSAGTYLEVYAEVGIFFGGFVYWTSRLPDLYNSRALRAGHSGSGVTLASVGGPVDEVRLTLGVHGRDLDPAEVSKILGCAPSSAHRRGDSRARGRPRWEQGAWLLSVEGRPPVTPDELVHGLLRRLPTDVTVWASLRSQYAVHIDFGLFFSGWNKGFELSPASIARLAALGAGIAIDVYSEGEDDGGPT